MSMVCTPENCDTCPGKIVCRCLQVTEEEIVNLITRFKVQSIRDIREHGGAGDGCTCCHTALQEYLQRYALAVVD